MVLVINTNDETKTKEILKEKGIKFSKYKTINEAFYEQEAESFLYTVVDDFILNDEDIKEKMIKEISDKFLETGMYTDDGRNFEDVVCIYNDEIN